jgi:prepilin-type processing-associated H-X9-DG protein
MFYEATPLEDGTRAVLFVDGHVERLNAKRWNQVRATPIVMRPMQDPTWLLSRIRAVLADDDNLKGAKISVSASRTQGIVAYAAPSPTGTSAIAPNSACALTCITEITVFRTISPFAPPPKLRSLRRFWAYRSFDEAGCCWA